jgi:hypothetical protein
MAALQDVRLEAMISASNAADAAIIEAFAGIAALLDQTPGRDTMGLQAGRAGRVQGRPLFLSGRRRPAWQGRADQY